MAAFQMFSFYISNIFILAIILYCTVKYLKRILIKNHNGSFYNQIVKNKFIHIISPKTNSDEFKKSFILLSSSYDISGIDCEWAPNKNISLIQISFPNGVTFLIRLFDSKDHIPNEVLTWLKDESKLKFGVGVLEDARKLESQWQIDIRGSVDLRHLAVRVRPNGLTKMGLKSLASSWLHVNYPYDDDTPKLKRVQCSNWEQTELSNEQIEYASLDGIVGALCPIEFLCRKLTLTPAEAIKGPGLIKAYCQGCIDLKFKDKTRIVNNDDNGHKKRNLKGVEQLVHRSTPIYDNAVLLSPDDEMLTRISRKKAEWYLRRDLAIQVSADPLVVKLSFEPAGRASGDNDYYLQEKGNVCVVCGSENNCVKKNIVPVVYRKHFPVSHKSHKSHDVLPLCIPCHRQSGLSDDMKMKQLSVEHDSPIGSKLSIDFVTSRVKNAARALTQNAQIPSDRVRELESIVASFYGIESRLSDGEIFGKYLQEAVNLQIGDCVSHGEKVVASLTGTLELFNFEVMWREHFVVQMRPKYLPMGWSTHHREERYLTDGK